MRLTLRTLLSYLDDTLDPAQTKQIGAKVAESEQARDLAERIKQVTRRRRLTTPPTTGPGGIDPNTIAEYLDNEVTPEKSAEVEQICLASDVHLAEVAACHQILTLVLGEPALVPPSAKQRMYGLVKGPEAIPFRKPAKQAAHADQDLSTELQPENEGDDTLRLGAPSLGKDKRNLLLIGGGGLLAVCFLGFAIWMLVGRGGGNTNVVDPKKDSGEQIAQNDKKDQGDKKTDEVNSKKDKTDWVPPPNPDKDKKDPIKDDAKNPEVKVEAVEVKPEKQPVEVAYAPASTKQVTVGTLVPPPAKAPAVLLQLKSEKAGWTRTDKDVSSGRTLLSLPGNINVVNLASGVELTLWGNLYELTFNPFLNESRAIVHANDLLDADVTLERGRIVLRNTKPGGKEATARVRFSDPHTDKEDHFDFTLLPDSAVMIERSSDMDREPFYDDPKDKLRDGPTAKMVVHAYDKTAHIKHNQVSYLLGDQQTPTLQWMSRDGTLSPPKAGTTFPPPSLTPAPVKDKNEQQFRDRGIKAANELNQILQKKETDVALAEYMQSVQKAAEREAASSKERMIGQDTIVRWMHAMRCYAAVDDIGFLFGEFSADPTPSQMRGYYMLTLRNWIALDRDNDYKLLDVVRRNYRKTESLNIMHLFHLIPNDRMAKPETYENLIEGLNNDLLPIRALSYWHLAGLVPEGRKILYDPAAPPQIRQKAVSQWLALVPPGKLPPNGMQLKKDKEKK